MYRKTIVNDTVLHIWKYWVDLKSPHHKKNNAVAMYSYGYQL